jgi:group I intron endonuclease
MDVKIKSGIYLIRNLINNRIYIGLSKNVIKRLTQHRSNLKCNRHKNPHLQSSYNKYGYENFEFKLIESCKEEDLTTKEVYWLEYYSKTSKVYNQAPAGNLGNGLKYDKHPRFNSTKYSFYNKDGKCEENITMFDFIEKYNLSRFNMYNLVNGKRKSVNGWMMNKAVYWIPIYCFINKSNKIEENITISELSSKYNIDLSSIYKVVNNKRKSAGGWSLNSNLKTFKYENSSNLRENSQRKRIRTT